MQHRGVATVLGEPVQLIDQPVAGDGAFDQTAQALASVLIDDGDDLDRPAVGRGVELEVDRPHPVRRIRDRSVGCGRGPEAFAAAALRHPEPFLPPQPLDLLVVDAPALAAGIVVGPAVTPPGMGFGIVPQPLPQRRIRIGWCRAGGLVALGGPVLPGHPAGEPLTQPHHGDEVVHGRAPACRAQKFP